MARPRVRWLAADCELRTAVFCPLDNIALTRNLHHIQYSNYSTISLLVFLQKISLALSLQLTIQLNHKKQKQKAFSKVALSITLWSVTSKETYKL